jgi:hypothetical protein
MWFQRIQAFRKRPNGAPTSCRKPFDIARTSGQRISTRKELSLTCSHRLRRYQSSSSKLPVKISMPRNLLISWSSSPVSLSRQFQEKMFAIDDEYSCNRLRLLVLSDRMLEPLRSGDTECPFIWFWDTVIRAVSGCCVRRRPRKP